MKKKDKKKERKLVLIIMISVSFLIVFTIFSTNNYKKNKVEDENINRMSKAYEESLDKSNNVKGADTIFRDGEGNIIEEHKGTTEISKGDKVKEEVTNKKADQYISNFVNNLNSGDYDRLYSLFNQNYLKEFEYSKETLKIKYKFKGGCSYKITNMEEKENRFIVTAKLIENNTGNIMLVDFTIYEDGTIADIPIYKEVDINKEKTFEEVTYRVKKRYESRLGSIYSIEIKNNSDKLIDVENLLIKNNDSIKTYQIISDYKEIKSYPGIDFNVMIKLPNTDSITSLEVRYKDLDGNMKKVDIYSEK